MSQDNIFKSSFQYPLSLSLLKNRVLALSKSQQPADVLIRQTAQEQWLLIGINLISSLVEALTEGATLGVVFLAVQVLSESAISPFNWASNPLVSWWPQAVEILNALPTTALFISLLGLAVLLQGLQSLTRFLNLVSVGYFAARCRALVTARIHSQILNFSFPCASSYKVGDLTDYAGSGPEAIRQQIELTSQLLVGSLLVATYLAVLVKISPWLLVAVLLMGGVITIIQKILLPRIRTGSITVTQAQVAISRRITENFQGLRLLHTSGQLGAADQKLQRSMDVLEHQLRGQVRRLSVVGPFSSFLPILAISLIACLSLLLFGGRSTGVLPSLVTFVVALQRLTVRVSGLASTFNQLSDNSGKLIRLNEILSPNNKQFLRKGGIPFKVLRRHIILDSVSLQYASTLRPALTDISVTINKGETVALVGPSGAGKSSVADLLTGLYTPTKGKILIDNRPLDEIDLASWQQRLGVVSQDTFLFNASIAENIAFGAPWATDFQIQSACHAALADRFIMQLPEGYDTFVGERGYRLSGGQRQRLSLARAILRDPELLILDEATSALDSDTERLVQQALDRFGKNHTVLVIAHRLSTIVLANQIFVMDAGRVQEQGTHNSLLAQDGLYKKLWDYQVHAIKPSTI